MKKLFVLGALALLLSTAHAADSYQDVFQSARDAYAAKQLPQAEALMKRALELAQTTKEKSDVLIRLATVAGEQGHFAQERDYWTQAAQFPETTPAEKATAQFAIGTTYFKEENFEATREAMQRVLDNKAATAELRGVARMTIGLSYGNANQWPQAIAAYEQVVSDPTLSADLRLLAQAAIGNAYISQDKLDEALAAFRAGAAIEGLSSQQRAKVQKGINSIHFKRNDIERVNAESDALKGEFTAKLQALLGKNKISDKNPQELALIRDNLEAILELIDFEKTTTGVNWQFNLGEAQLALKEYEKSREAFGKILANSAPPDATGENLIKYQAFRQGAQFNIASSYQQQGQTEVARQGYQKLSETPDLNPVVKAATQTALGRLK